MKLMMMIIIMMMAMMMMMIVNGDVDDDVEDDDAQGCRCEWCSRGSDADDLTYQLLVVKDKMR